MAHYFFKKYIPSRSSSFSSETRPDKKLCSCWIVLSYGGSAMQNICSILLNKIHNMCLLTTCLKANQVLLTLRVLWIRSNAILPKFVSIPTMNFCNKNAIQKVRSKNSNTLDCFSSLVFDRRICCSNSFSKHHWSSFFSLFKIIIFRFHFKSNLRQCSINMKRCSTLSWTCV